MKIANQLLNSDFRCCYQCVHTLLMSNSEVRRPLTTQVTGCDMAVIWVLGYGLDLLQQWNSIGCQSHPPVTHYQNLKTNPLLHRPWWPLSIWLPYLYRQTELSSPAPSVCHLETSTNASSVSATKWIHYNPIPPEDVMDTHGVWSKALCDRPSSW